MKYFGTDGFRGEANVGLTVEHAYKIGRFVGWYYGANRSAKARVIVGKDTRRSSYMFEAALVSGLVASGADGLRQTGPLRHAQHVFLQTEHRMRQQLGALHAHLVQRRRVAVEDVRAVRIDQKNCH